MVLQWRIRFKLWSNGFDGIVLGAICVVMPVLRAQDFANGIMLVST